MKSLRDIQKKYIPKQKFGTVGFNHNDYHPDSIIPQPPHQITRDGEVVAKPRGVSKVCLRCNSDNVMPVRLSGLTLYECLKCRHVWRDSYDDPGPTLRPKEWRGLGLRGGLRPKKWQRLQGRVLI